MGVKIIRVLVVFFISLLLTPFVIACDNNSLVRVGITDEKFQNVLRKQTIIYSTSDAEICDKISHKRLLHVNAGSEIVVTNSISGLNVVVDNQVAILRDFVVISPTGLVGIKGLTRKGKPALYHGAFEVVQKKDHSGFYVVNLVELQEYLKGVVPNEMPIKFGLEALKAQTIAARNYVLTPRERAYDEFSVVDSVSSQVYFGANTETDISTQAVMETDGIVALYNNDLILTLYSSTAGGYTESYAYAFSNPATKEFPSEHKPYLVATPDRENFKTLENEDDARNFYTSKIPSYDIDSPYYRWEKNWAIGELENVLKKTLIVQSKTGFISPAFKHGDSLGEIKDIKVMRRGQSGKVIELDLMTTKGCYRISKELVIRRVFQKDGISLPSANFVINKSTDNYGNLIDVTFQGGGFGHGVGMSQYGAGYMASKLKQPYYNILRHYYSGISLGTIPVEVFDSEIKQTFWAPIARAKLVLTGNIPSQIKVAINCKEYLLPVEKTLFQKEVKIDISRYIEDGANSIVYYPAQSDYKIYVELVEAYSKPVEDCVEELEDRKDLTEDDVD